MTDVVTDDSTLDTLGHGRAASAEAGCMALVLAWSAAEPSRIGEVVLLPDEDTPYVLGRGDAPAESHEARAELVRQRPGKRAGTRPLEDPFLSREQLRLRSRAGSVEVENLGKRSLLVRDGAVAGATLRPGETVEIKNRLVFICAVRPRQMRSLKNGAQRDAPPFGEADEHGFVGESVAAWDLRECLAFNGPRPAHVLLLGPSGTGKELAAHALHACSPRRANRLVARSASTLPQNLIDAELFGNAADYPEKGMPERPGLVGEAHGSTLFLDGIGQLSSELETHLLRLLDAGEYQRLGDPRRKTSDLRVLAASNRGVHSIQEDMAARFLLRIDLPGLDARREDIPLIARHLLKRIASRDAAMGKRFLEGWDGSRGEPRVAPALVRALIEHTYTTHVRELERLLWRSLATSKSNYANLTDQVRADLAAPGVGEGPRAAVRTDEVTADEIRAALASHKGKREAVWRRLGLANRYVLRRLMKKYAIGDGEPQDVE